MSYQIHFHNGKYEEGQFDIVTFEVALGEMAMKEYELKCTDLNRYDKSIHINHLPRLLPFLNDKEKLMEAYVHYWSEQWNKE